MKISIIVPVYNSYHLLNCLIDSLLCQKYQNWELILVDDGSTDDSYNNMKKLERKYNNIFVYHQENSGPGMARNKGLLKSNGDLCFFVDSDDWITSDDSLEKINNYFLNYEIDLLLFNREEITSTNRKLIKSFQKLSLGIHNLNDINEKIRPGMGSKIFKRKKLTNDMFITTRVYEDLYATYMYMDKINKFYVTDDIFYSINRRNDNINNLSSIINYKTIEGLKTSTNTLLKIYYSMSSEHLKRSIAKYMINNYLTYKCILLKYKTVKKDNLLKNQMKECFEIIKKYDDEFEPENNKLIKKVLFYIYIKRKKR